MNRKIMIYSLLVFIFMPISVLPQTGTICLIGSPEEIGRKFGELNASFIQEDVYAFVKEAATGINDVKCSENELKEYSKEFIKICEFSAGSFGNASHWLTEAKAIARAAGPGPYKYQNNFEDIYIAYIALTYRKLWYREPKAKMMDECTSYAYADASHTLPENNKIFFHKNRDNVDKPQALCIIKSAGLNKFITVTDPSILSCMMMVNEKGLAGSADMGEESDPYYDGMMNTFILRYIAEYATTVDDAENIIRAFLGEKHYAGAHNETNWLFADKYGNIKDISHGYTLSSLKVTDRYRNSPNIYYKYRTPGENIDKLFAEVELNNVPFSLFHSISRKEPIWRPCSISGFSVEIDQERPDLLTAVWVSFPAKGLAFPVFMCCTELPVPFVDGEIYNYFKPYTPAEPCWKILEENLYNNQKLKKAEFRSMIRSGNTESARISANVWIKDTMEKQLGDYLYWDLIDTGNYSFIYAKPDAMFICTGAKVKKLENGQIKDWVDFTENLEYAESFTCIAGTDSYMYGLTNMENIYRWKYDKTGFKPIDYNDNWFLCADKTNNVNHLYVCTNDVIKELHDGRLGEDNVFPGINKKFTGLTATQSYFYGLTPDGEIWRFDKDGNNLFQVGFCNNQFIFAQSIGWGYTTNELYNCCNSSEVKRLVNGNWIDFIKVPFDVICATNTFFYGLINGKIYRKLKTEINYN